MASFTEELTQIFREGIKTQSYLRNRDIMKHALGIVRTACAFTLIQTQTQHILSPTATQSSVLAHFYPAPTWYKYSVKSSGNKTAT